MLRVAVSNMAAYDAFYKRLIDAMPLKNVTSRFCHGTHQIDHGLAHPGRDRVQPASRASVLSVWVH